MRRILKLLIPHVGKLGLLKYVLLGILSGLFSFLFINIVTKIIGLIIAGKFTTISKEYIVILAAVILLFIWIRRTLSLGVIKLSQTLSWKLRKEILLSVLHARYQQLIIKKVEVHSTILSDVYILTDASVNLISFTTALILSISCLIYLATISFVLFLITLVVASVGATLYHFGSKKNNQDFENYRDYENKFLESLNAILDGFKEIYMEPKIGRSIYENKINKIALGSYDVNVKAFTGFLNNQITGQVLFYLLISSVLLFFSIILKIPSADIVSFVFTLLYLLGAIETVMILLPSLMRARVASNRLMNLKSELEESSNSDQTVSKANSLKFDFLKIEIRDLEFHYTGSEKDFGIGPINFNIKKEDIIFIYGGNGSGKTTFIHSILGLCVPTHGNIILNDTILTEANYSSYRSLFSVVFSDFYLFNELYAIESLAIEKWNYYIELFELGGKVKIENNCFSTTNLSTGQRKRLALIAVLLEEKPVLVIDEWAADQDPYFRKKFYLEIIPLLKKNGLTIIAITHDDKYYNCADKLFKMEDGNLMEEDINNHIQNIILT